MINDYLEHQIKTISKLKESTGTIQKILEIILEARNNEQRVYVMGNGGSASTATHGLGCNAAARNTAARRHPTGYGNRRPHGLNGAGGGTGTGTRD